MKPIKYTKLLCIATIIINSMNNAHAQFKPANTPETKAVQNIDRIAVIVNNNVITKRELLSNANTILQQLKNMGKEIKVNDQDFLREVLERLITDKVLLQRARDTKINFNDSEMNEIIKYTAQQNKMTEQQYLETLSKAGVNLPQWREDQKNNIILGRLRQKEVEPRVKVSESEIDSYISSLAGVTVAPLEEFNISRILIPNGNGNSTNANISNNTNSTTNIGDQDNINKAFEKANQILSDIKDSKITFEQAIKYYSKAPESNAAISNITISDISKLPTEVSSVLLRIKRQQIWPEVIETSNGFYILRLNDKIIKENQRQQAVIIPQTKVRQILIRVSGTNGNGVSEKEAKERLLALKKRINAGEDMGALATLYSQDGSASNGGSMNWVNAGETVPEFEQAMDVLSIGNVSNPVRTDYGYHLIQVLDRKLKTVPVVQQRDEVRNILKERKTEIAYQDWIKELRQRAFVEYKIEQLAPIK
jgi:peptidyl-prolyl cis-trans isomerase SurA